MLDLRPRGAAGDRRVGHLHLKEVDKELYLNNAKSWLKSWVEGSCNHPSIVLWNVENEMSVWWMQWLSKEELREFGQVVAAADPTAPRIYEGDEQVEPNICSIHFTGTGWEWLKVGTVYLADGEHAVVIGQREPNAKIKSVRLVRTRHWALDKDEWP